MFREHFFISNVISQCQKATEGLHPLYHFPYFFTVTERQQVLDSGGDNIGLRVGMAVLSIALIIGIMTAILLHKR